jgi:hypothetical protein
MNFIRYSNAVDDRCDTCSCDAGYGFFVGVTPVHELSRSRDETFLCSGCAQKSFDRGTLQEAIDEAQEADEEATWNSAIAGWINYEAVAG